MTRPVQERIQGMDTSMVVSQRPAEMNLVGYTGLFNVLKGTNHNL